MIITIDGPSGTGKSTVAKGVAKRLGFTFFDTGAMYRSFAWWIQKEGIDPSEEKKVCEAVPRFQYEIRSTQEGERRYFVNGEEVSGAIRSQSISMIASQIAVYACVRQSMVEIQRKFGSSVDAVFEGRDMGTVVFPQAELKIFLTARPQVRAARRYRELAQKFPDLQISEAEILREIEERDQTDSNRAISPLKQAPDAVLIDTSELTSVHVIEKIVQLKPKRLFPKMKPFYRFIYSLARFYFKVFFHLRVQGLEHFKPGAAIIAANHSSHYDPPVLSISCPEEVQFLAKGYLFDIPFLGWLIRHLNSHPIAQGSSDVQTLKMMIELLKQGKKLILFPEGKRSEDGTLQPLERGLSFLVQKAQCPIIPAYIQGAYEAWPRWKRFPRIFGKITVAFGEPIEWEQGMGKKEAQENLLIRTESAIQNLKAAIASNE